MWQWRSGVNSKLFPGGCALKGRNYILRRQLFMYLLTDKNTSSADTSAILDNTARYTDTHVIIKRII